MQINKNTTAPLMIQVSTEQSEWVEQRALDQRWSVGAIIRGLLDDAMRTIPVTKRTEPTEPVAVRTELAVRTERVLQVISDAGPAGIRRGTLSRRTQWLFDALRSSILDQLVRDGLISSRVEPLRTKPAVVWVATRAPVVPSCSGSHDLAAPLG